MIRIDGQAETAAFMRQGGQPLTATVMRKEGQVEGVFPIHRGDKALEDILIRGGCRAGLVKTPAEDRVEERRLTVIEIREGDRSRPVVS